MFKKILLVAVLISGGLTLAQAQEIWVGKDGNIRNVDTRAALVDKDAFYLATKSEVYRARDISGKWESIFFLPSGGNEITCLSGTAKNVFVGTKRGLFRSLDYGATWRNVFKTIIPDKNNILSIEVSRHDPKKVIIGTKSGIFMSEDSGDRWQDITDNLKNSSISCLALNKESVYAGGDSGLFVRREGADGWERLLVKSSAEKIDAGEELSDDIEQEEEDEGAVNCVSLKDGRLYAGFDKKILYSDDKGGTWNNFPADGLTGAINYILPSPKSEKLYSATTKGVFEFDKDKSRWLELYKGMDKNIEVTKLVFGGDGNGSLWALTDNGIYRLEGGRYVIDQYVDVEKSLKKLKVSFDNEPTFAELQKAAMEFAEVSPEKIRGWRNQARLKALVPKISFDMDKNRSTNSEIYTSATKDYIVLGPEDETNSFDVSVSWELGNLIWSSDQTSIDTRSRLTTQLRNDVLDDLRRAYYERKRVQFELMTNPPQDLKARFEKEMRFQELTQAIDDLTGNYLSENIKN